MNPGDTYRKRYVTRHVLAIYERYIECRDEWIDGTSRIVLPHRGQMERWVRGARLVERAKCGSANIP